MNSNYRPALVRDALRCLRSWAQQTEHARALLIVGSWARGTATPDSDIDVMLLTREKDTLTSDDAWLEVLDGELVRRQTWGVVEERRLRLATGLTVEINVAATDWARVSPMDEGTAHVVRTGAVALYDPDGLLERLLGALEVPRTSPDWLPAPDRTPDR